jgi:hypothetical protein
MEEVLVIIPARRHAPDDPASTETLGRFTIQMPVSTPRTDGPTTVTLTGDRPASATLPTTLTLPSLADAPATLSLLLERLRRSPGPFGQPTGSPPPHPAPPAKPEPATAPADASPKPIGPSGTPHPDPAPGTPPTLNWPARSEGRRE